MRMGRQMLLEIDACLQQIIRVFYYFDLGYALWFNSQSNNQCSNWSWRRGWICVVMNVRVCRVLKGSRRRG